MFKTGKTIQAGQPGTKKWTEMYGDKLVCVRYKYDNVNMVRLKTVELIVEEKSWVPEKSRIPANKLIGIRVRYVEMNLRKLVKGAGGIWNREKGLWELRYQDAVALGLEKRMVFRDVQI